MKIGIYGDPHITKKLSYISDEWDASILNTFKNMYETFKNNKVDKVVCLGDFFDSSVLEASSVKKVTEVLSIINDAEFKTHILLGNHEVHGPEGNVLEFLNYENIKPEILLSSEEGLLFVPYTQSLEELDKLMFKDKIVFTHHDIYGSKLSGGKSKATFGVDRDILKDAKLVINGHVHNRWRAGNVINAGSLFTTQFGELDEVYRDKPCYYILDTESLGLEIFQNDDSIMFVTVDAETLEEDLSIYSNNKKVLRIMYEKEEDIPLNREDDEKVLRVVLRKKLPGSMTTDVSDKVINGGTLDLKSFVVKYIEKDETLLPEERQRLIELSKIILRGVKE